MEILWGFTGMASEPHPVRPSMFRPRTVISIRLTYSDSLGYHGVVVKSLAILELFQYVWHLAQSPNARLVLVAPPCLGFEENEVEVPGLQERDRGFSPIPLLPQEPSLVGVEHSLTIPKLYPPLYLQGNLLDLGNELRVQVPQLCVGVVRLVSQPRHPKDISEDAQRYPPRERGRPVPSMGRSRRRPSSRSGHQAQGQASVSP